MKIVRGFTHTLRLALRHIWSTPTDSSAAEPRKLDIGTTLLVGARTRMPNVVSGFTLIEVLITVALSVILMLAIEKLYVVYGRVIISQKSSIEVALGGNKIMDAARAAGSQAKQVVAAHSFSGTSYDSSTTTAIFELPAVDASGAIIAGAYDYIGIHASGTVAYRLVDAAPGSARVPAEKRLTSVLDALSFAYDSQSFPSVTSVVVEATTSAVVRDETIQTHLRERVYLRNL